MNPIHTGFHFKIDIRFHLDFDFTSAVRHIETGILDDKSFFPGLVHVDDQLLDTSVLRLYRDCPPAVIIGQILLNLENQFTGSQTFGSNLPDPVDGNVHRIPDICLDFHFNRPRIGGQIERLRRDDNTQIGGLPDRDGLHQIVHPDRHRGRAVFISRVGIATDCDGDRTVRSRTPGRRHGHP